MVRRLISIFLVLLVCASFTAITFAASGEPVDAVHYSVFAFDRVSVGAGYVAPAGWNDANSDVAVVDCETQRGGVYLSSLTEFDNNYEIVCTNYLPDLDGVARFTFETQCLYFDTAADHFTLQLPNVAGVVTVSCEVLSYGLRNGQYELISTPVLRSYEVTTFFDISNALAECAGKNGILGFSNVQVSYESRSSYTGNFVFVVRSNGYLSADFPSYQEAFVSAWNMPYSDVATLDVGTFLVQSVGSFLEFEIIPGLSISGILGIIVSIAVVLWFITLLV